MNIILFCSLIVGVASSLFGLYRQLQMLQQNSYFPSRYFGWIKESFSVELSLEAIAFCLSSLLFANSRFKVQLVLLCIILLVRIFLSRHYAKTSIKGLVFTARIKRLFSAAFLLEAVCVLLYALSPQTLVGEIGSVACFALIFVLPLLTYASWAVTKPIEDAFSRWYINDAKKILRSVPNLTVIGVTGSYGKTTTKFILSRILSEKYNVLATPQSFNTPMGVVRTVRERLKPSTQIFVCEMGAKNIGDIKEICDIVNPDIGIIASVGAQHLETFRSVDNVFKTKFELADAVLAKKGSVFVNLSSKELKERIGKNFPSVKSYGLESSAEFYAENIRYGRDGSTFDLCLGEEKLSVSTKLLGLHSVNNIVAAAAVAYSLGVCLDDIKFAIAGLKPTEHRLELKSFKNGSLLIDDAYNANPEGSLEAVRVLGSFEGMRKVIITPGLIELGAKEYECNYALGLESAKYCDDIILVGLNRSKPLREAVESTDFDKSRLHIVSSFAEAMSVYAPTADSNSVVLLENDLPDNYLN